MIAGRRQSVRFQAFDGTYVLCGDCCYLRRTLTHEHLPPFAWDRERQLRSIRRLAAEQRAGATLLFDHDQDRLDRIVTEGLHPGVRKSALLDDEVAVEQIGVDGLHLDRPETGFGEELSGDLFAPHGAEALAVE